MAYREAAARRFKYTLPLSITASGGPHLQRTWNQKHGISAGSLAAGPLGQTAGMRATGMLPIRTASRETSVGSQQRGVREDHAVSHRLSFAIASPPELEHGAPRTRPPGYRGLHHSLCPICSIVLRVLVSGSQNRAKSRWKIGQTRWIPGGRREREQKQVSTRSSGFVEVLRNTAVLLMVQRNPWPIQQPFRANPPYRPRPRASFPT